MELTMFTCAKMPASMISGEQFQNQP